MANWGLTVIFLYLISIAAFFLSWALHELKSKNAKPWVKKDGEDVKLDESQRQNMIRKSIKKAKEIKS